MLVAISTMMESNGISGHMYKLLIGCSSMWVFQYYNNVALCYVVFVGVDIESWFDFVIYLVTVPIEKTDLANSLLLVAVFCE